MKIEFINTYCKTFDEITANYKERTSGISYTFVPIVVLIIILQILEVIEFINPAYKAVIIIYISIVSCLLAIIIWIKNFGY